MITEHLVLGMVNFSEDVVKEHSQIFGYQRETAVLTEWQKAFDLAKENPSLMYERGTLKDIVEEKAWETYVFKKKSGSHSCKVQGESMPKRMKFNQDERCEKIAELSTEIEMLKRQITTKQKAISQTRCMKDYKLCDKAHGEMRELFQWKGKLKKKLKEFQKRIPKAIGITAAKIILQQCHNPRDFVNQVPSISKTLRFQEKKYSSTFLQIVIMCVCTPGM